MTVALCILGYLFGAVIFARFDKSNDPLLAGFFGLVWPVIEAFMLLLGCIAAVGWVANWGRRAS